MRVLILTSVRRGTAARCLPALVSSPNIDVVGIVLAGGDVASRRREIRRKIRKTLRIGILGALNGLRLREWFCDREAEDIVAVAQRYNIRLYRTPSVNADETRTIFKNANADLGLSLGNTYIAQSVFSVPRHGMINVHCELLPDFKGAQSIIWPIFEGRQETGFTIHQIDKHIDTGPILFQKSLPIFFYPTLRETVEKNLKTVRGHIPEGVTWLCRNYEQVRSAAIAQKNGGPSYTTPSIWQFWRMLRNHKAMYRQGNTPGRNLMSRDAGARR